MSPVLCPRFQVSRQWEIGTGRRLLLEGQDLVVVDPKLDILQGDKSQTCRQKLTDREQIGQGGR